MKNNGSENTEPLPKVSAIQKVWAKMSIEYWLTFVKQHGENDNIENHVIIGYIRTQKLYP
jgi:hypothetical protein